MFMPRVLYLALNNHLLKLASMQREFISPLTVRITKDKYFLQKWTFFLPYMRDELEHLQVNALSAAIFIATE